MTVVINEFEVVAEPPPPASAQDTPPPEAAPAASTPHDIELIWLRLTERQARISTP
jgi:hypothetical protein